MKTVKEVRKILRNLEPYREEFELGSRVIIKTTGGYAVRGKNDYDDPMTDYSAYIYGFKEKWIIERALQEKVIVNE